MNMNYQLISKMKPRTLALLERGRIIPYDYAEKEGYLDEETAKAFRKGRAFLGRGRIYAIDGNIQYNETETFNFYGEIGSE